MDASHLSAPMKTAIAFALCLVAGVASAQTPPATPPSTTARATHIVLVGDSTVTEGSGWGLGFRQLVAPEVVVTNTAQNGRSSKSFRDEGHWATALEAKGDYYLIQFGHNDQPGKGPERETDPATTFPANMARYVDDVRAIGATPILVTSLVRRTFNDVRHFTEREPAKLASTLVPWVEALKRVAAEKRVPLIDLDASSRALCERLGPAETARFDVKKDDGTWDTTHLDAAGSLVFAKLVVADLRRVVPALAPLLRDEVAAAVEEPPDLPAPLPLLLPPSRAGVRHPEARAGRVYTRTLRLERYARRMAFQGREPDTAALPPLVTSPAILVAWDYVPIEPPPGAVCGFAEGAPTRVFMRVYVDERAESPPAIQPLTVTFDRARIRELLAPYETDVARVRFLAVLDPARLRAPSWLMWQTTVPCEQEMGTGPELTAALIDTADIARWLAPSAAAR
jgi:lysophospholipase L1-like esterase